MEKKKHRGLKIALICVCLFLAFILVFVGGFLIFATATVIGDHERDDKTVTYRRFGAQQQITVSIDVFLKLIKDEIVNKVIFKPENK